MNKGAELNKMIVLATRLHRNQFDRAGQPYILHPLHVMSQLDTTDEELQCIALGHDLIEDTSCTADYLRVLGFSGRVISGIEGLTKQQGQSYEDYQAQVMAARDRMLVKLEDLRHNSDLNRLSRAGIVPTQKDVDRQQRYLDFIDLINQHLN